MEAISDQAIRKEPSMYLSDINKVVYKCQQRPLDLLSFYHELNVWISEYIRKNPNQSRDFAQSLSKLYTFFLNLDITHQVLYKKQLLLYPFSQHFSGVQFLQITNIKYHPFKISNLFINTYLNFHYCI